MNKVLVIIIIILAVNLIALWSTLGVKWLLMYTDWRSKKDYLRGIEENLSKYADRLDKSIILTQKMWEYLNHEGEFRK